MMTAAARALAYTISDDELSVEYIIPSAFDKKAHENLIKAVKKAAKDSGVARV